MLTIVDVDPQKIKSPNTCKHRETCTVLSHHRQGIICCQQYEVNSPTTHRQELSAHGLGLLLHGGAGVKHAHHGTHGLGGTHGGQTGHTTTNDQHLHTQGGFELILQITDHGSARKQHTAEIWGQVILTTMEYESMMVCKHGLQAHADHD